MAAFRHAGQSKTPSVGSGGTHPTCTTAAYNVLWVETSVSLFAARLNATNGRAECSRAHASACQRRYTEGVINDP